MRLCDIYHVMGIVTTSGLTVALGCVHSQLSLKFSIMQGVGIAGVLMEIGNLDLYTACIQ